MSLDGDLVAVGFEDDAGFGGDEGVACDAFASHDGFEEEGVLAPPAFGEAFEGGDGGEVVGEEGAIDGESEVAVGRGLGGGDEGLELVEGWDVDGW